MAERKAERKDAFCPSCRQRLFVASYYTKYFLLYSFSQLVMGYRLFAIVIYGYKLLSVAFELLCELS